MSSRELSLSDSVAELDDDALQRLLASVVKAYSQRQQDGVRFPALPPDGAVDITGTDAVIAASAILESASVEIFELGMWKALGAI